MKLYHCIIRILCIIQFIITIPIAMILILIYPIVALLVFIYSGDYFSYIQYSWRIEKLLLKYNILNLIRE